MVPFNKFPIVLQQSSSDCGVASLSAIVTYFGGEKSLENLRDLSGTTIHGTTVLGLIEAASALFMEADAFRADGLFRLDYLESPVILHVVIDDKYNHFVVFFGKDGSDYMIMDPAIGRIKLSADELNQIWQSKTLIILNPGDEFLTKHEYKSHKKKWIGDLVRPDLPVLFISGILGLIVTVLGLSVSVFSQKLIDKIIPNEEWKILTVGLILLTLLLVSRSLLAFLRSTVLIRQGKELNLRLITDFFQHLLSLPKRFFDSRKIGDVTARMNDSRRIQRAISILTTELMVDLFVVLVTLLSIFLYSHLVGLFVIAFIPLYFLIVFSYHPSIKRRQQQLMARYSSSESFFIDTLSGVTAIHSTGRESEFLDKNLRFYEDFQDGTYQLGQVSNRLALASQLTGTLFSVTILGTCCYLLISARMNLGVLVAISGMMGMLVPAVNKLALSNFQIQEAKIALDRLYEFVHVKGEVKQQGPPISIPIESLKITKMSFRFPGRSLLLKDLNFELKRGVLTVLLGESGGGKSTLLQLLMAFYKSEQGDILINNSFSFRDFSISKWRMSIGYVPQEIKIFNGTLIYNLTLMDSATHIQAVTDFCKTIDLNLFFEALPQGYYTLLGEEGVNLSGGQRQLVGLVRALLQRPKILLLDEFTGAMDRNTEQKILELILRMKEIIPIMIVTHRIKPALLADKVLILENGQITSEGSPEELLDGSNLLSSAYYDLVK